MSEVVQPSPPRGNLAPVHTRLSLRTQISLSVKAETLYWQRWPVFAELEECDKVSGATTPRGPELLSKLTEHRWWAACIRLYRQAAFAEEALSHISAQICAAAVYWEWEARVEISGGKQLHRWEEDRDRTGDERRSCEGWDGGHGLRAAPISLLENDQSTGTNTHTHIYSNCANSAALIRADMPFILLLLEHTPQTASKWDYWISHCYWAHSGPGISLLALKCLHPHYLNIFTCHF